MVGEPKRDNENEEQQKHQHLLTLLSTLLGHSPVIVYSQFCVGTIGSLQMLTAPDTSAGTNTRPLPIQHTFTAPYSALYNELFSF
jgi:hypothetical protein